ncbi:MAG: TetR/AcrR family transcriptional regulator [Roseburia sp.]
MRRNSANIFARECIVDALLRLTKTKPLSAISISELTEVAGVSRMTFYRNYNSKEEVFESCLDDIIREYQQEECELPDGGAYYDMEHLEHCFQYFARHREFLNGMFQCGFSNTFLEKLTSYILEKWCDASGSNRYELYSFAGALYNVYIGWSADGCRESVEDMALVLNRIYCKKDLHF